MFNRKQQQELNERFERETKIIDRQIEVYRQEKTLEVNTDIQSRKTTNWKEVDDARVNRIEIITTIKTEVAKLEAKKESLTEVLKANEKLLAQKDAEIKRLNDIVTLLINKQPNTVIQQQK